MNITRETLINFTIVIPAEAGITDKSKFPRVQSDIPGCYKTEFLSQVQVITRKQGTPEKRMNIMKF
jgi:hypothetical protein